MTRPARKDGEQGAKAPTRKASVDGAAKAAAKPPAKRPGKAAAVSPTIKSLTRVTRPTIDPVDVPRPADEHVEREHEVASTEDTSIDAASTPVEQASSPDAPRARPEQGFQPRRAEHPRRVHHGIRLRRKAGMEGLPWWAQAWLKGMETGFAEAVRIEGLQY
ncbi:MAG: hypothetical protein RL527_681, partial [Planctomycetota bacterium]